MDSQIATWFNAQLEQLQLPWESYFPEALLAGWSLCLVLGLLLRKRAWMGPATIGVFVLLGAGLMALAVRGGTPPFAGMYQAQPWMRFLHSLMAFSAAWATGLLSLGPDEGTERKDSEPLWITLVLLGSLLLTGTRHGIFLFFSLELISIPSYLLVAGRSAHAGAAEAALKYFLFGVAASALMLYGVSWCYGFGGSLYLDAQGLALAPVSVQVGIPLLVLAGLWFKAGIFPLHFWVPDTYSGAGLSVSAFLSLTPKIAAMGAIWNLLGAWDGLPGFPLLRLALVAVALASMIAGNLGALVQQDFLRLMAFSGVAHAGFLLMAAAAGGEAGGKALGFYLTLYAIMNAGAFLGAFFLMRESGSAALSTWQGLGRNMGLTGIAFVVALAGLAGLPPSGGFIAKWWVFAAIWENLRLQNTLVAWVALGGTGLNAVIGVFYYLRIAAGLYFTPKNRVEERPFSARPWPVAFLAVLAAALTLVLGIWGFDRLANYLGQVMWNF
jgi:NADH-quinone oxidoreductase subunit N